MTLKLDKIESSDNNNTHHIYIAKKNIVDSAIQWLKFATSKVEVYLERRKNHGCILFLTPSLTHTLTL